MADDLRHRHRGLFWRRLEFRASDRGIWRVLVTFFRHAAGDQAEWALSRPAALRSLSMARHGPDPLHPGFARHRPGARLAFETGRPEALPPPAGRYRLHRVLVSIRTARAFPGDRLTQ